MTYVNVQSLHSEPATTDDVLSISVKGFAKKCRKLLLLVLACWYVRTAEWCAKTSESRDARARMHGQAPASVDVYF